MKNKTILPLVFLSLVFGLSSSNVVRANAGANEVKAPSQDYLESTEDFLTYYNEWKIDGLSKSELLNQLAKKMAEEHKYYTSYDDVKGANAYSDEDPDDETKIISFYAGVDIPNFWNAGSLWNREHVWCKSLSNGLYTNVAATGRGAGADIHQLKPAIKSINESRGNKPYADLNHQGNQKEYNNKPTGCYFNEKYFEPRDEVKGDIARILMYMYTHYSSEVESNVSRVEVANSKTTSKAGDLKIEQIIATTENRAQSSWNQLLKWSEEDPVDSFEAKRNDYCASITGLRNPFIDYPEFATMIWSEDYCGEGALLDTKYDLDEDIPLVAMNFYHTEVFMRIGEKRKLNIDFHPYYASSQYKEVTWESSNPEVAMMEDSLLVAKGKGTATIKAISGSLFAECEVTVDEAEKAAVYTIDTKSSVKESGTILEGSSAEYSQTHQTKGQMTANNSTTLVLKGYTGYRIIGISLTMRSNGTGGSGGLKATVGDTIIASISNGTPFSSELWAGRYSTAFVDVPIKLKDNTRKILEGEVVTIQITASANSLYIDSYAIDYTDDFSDVPIRVSGLTLSHNEVILKKGETLQLVATVLPENADNKNVMFFSNRPGVVSVSDDGLVTALRKGTAVITVTTDDGNFEATCNITVEEDKPKSGCTKTSTSIIISFVLLGLITTFILKKKEL